MRRKLCSVLLSAFALLLLMGAGNETVPDVNKEESGATGNSVSLETVIQFKVNNTDNKEFVLAEEQKPATPVDEGMFINRQPASMEIGRVQKAGVTYVSLSEMAKALDAAVQVHWNAENNQMTLTTAGLNMTAKMGDLYLAANGRYLYLGEPLQNMNGTVMVPLWAVAEAFDAKVTWNSVTDVVIVTTGSGAIQSGESYYNQDDLFWLSRLIYAESGNQPLSGQVAVGNVVMNRVKSHLFPNTILGVVSQKNQFSVYKNGALANRTPNETSIIAAKLVLDGGVEEQTEGAMYFDSLKSSWASRSRQHVATIGNHKFYR